MNSASEKRRIVLVGPAYPLRGGIAHFSDCLARYLKLDGYCVEIVTFRRLYPKALFPGKSQWEPDVSENSFDHTTCLDSLNPLTWFGAALRIAENMPQAVLFQYWEPFLAPMFGSMTKLLRRKGLKVFCIAHNSLPHQRRPGAVIFGRYFLRNCTGVIALSRKVENDLQKVLKLTVNVTRLYHPLYDHFGDPISLEAARNKLDIPSNVRMVLFFGLVRKYKGLDVLLEAMRKVIQVLPDVRLVVAGEFYEGREKCRSFIRAHSLEEHVRLEDRYIPKSEVADFFCAADIVALPYLSGTQSGVLSIAYHFEKPFIVSDVGGIAEMAPKNGGFTVRPGDAGDLAQALLNFFKRADRAEIREFIRQKKMNYSWQRFCASIGPLFMRP